MDTKSERFEMRLDPGILERVNNWRAGQADLPSRAEAVRRLIDSGLSRTGTNTQFSNGEKLIMLMLCDVYKHLKISGEIDPDFIQSALFGGHSWSFARKMSGIFHGHEDNKNNVTEVDNVLEMWWFIEISYGKLSKEDQELIAKEADPFGKGVSFRGFDGNNESEHLGIAEFLINDMNLYSHFKDRDLSSHAPLLGSYRRMLAVFEPMLREMLRTFGGGDLSTKQIIELLNAMRHT